MKKFWQYMEILTCGGFVCMGLYFIMSGFINGEIYYPAFLSGTELVSIAKNKMGFYFSLLLWIGITIFFSIFGLQVYRKTNS